MLVREYTEADLEALRRMHASQGFDYPFPNLSDPIFISKLVVEDDSGRAVMASLARLTCEMYLLVDRENAFVEQGSLPAVLCRADPSASGHTLSSRGPLPAEGSLFDFGLVRAPVRSKEEHARARWAQLLALHRAAERDLLARGLDDAHAWLPPPIARRFGRRLESLGWVRDDAWTPYCRRLR